MKKPFLTGLEYQDTNRGNLYTLILGSVILGVVFLDLGTYFYLETDGAVKPKFIYYLIGVACLPVIIVEGSRFGMFWNSGFGMYICALSVLIITHILSPSLQEIMEQLVLLLPNFNSLYCPA